MLPIMVTMLPILVTLKTMNRHMQQIDQQTGEVVEGFGGLCRTKAQKRISERMDGNGSRSNDDACTEQFNRQ